MSFFYFISFYFLFLFSIVGYGNLFKSIFSQKENNLGYLGIFGILTLIIFTYFINFFIPIYPIKFILLIIGVFIYKFLINNFKILKKIFNFNPCIHIFNNFILMQKIMTIFHIIIFIHKHHYTIRKCFWFR